MAGEQVDAFPLDQVWEGNTLKLILTSFREATGLRAAVVDMTGKARYLPENDERPRFCNMVRSSPLGLKRCCGSYARAGVQAARIGEPYIFRCHAGLIGWAAPIMLDRAHVGTVICGQVLMWEPEEFFWLEVAEMTRDLGLDQYELRRASTELKILSAQKVQAASHLLFLMTSSLTQAGLVTLRQRQMINAQQEKLGEEMRARKELETLLKHIKRESSYRLLFSKEQNLLTRVKLRDWTAARKALDELMVDILLNTSNRADLVKARFLELMVILSRAAAEAGANAEHLMETNNCFLEDLTGRASIEESCLWLKEFLEMIVTLVERNKNQKNLQIVQRVSEYMEANMSQQLALDDIARAVHFSPYYLSHLFRQEIGCTVMEYLTKLRIEKAKRLLRDPASSVSEVLREVGYQDPSYFTKVFKKLTGVTPSTYRQRFGGVPTRADSGAVTSPWGG